MIGRTDRRIRLIVLLLVFVTMAGAIVTRLAYWQVSRAGDLRQLAISQLERSATEQPVRGDILDRRGTVLATTAYFDLLSAHPEHIPDDARADVVERIATILELRPRERAELAAQLTSDDPYVVLTRRLTEAQSDAVEQGIAERELPGVSLEPRPYRFYPNPGGVLGTTLASQLLGFVTEDGVGRYGIEQYYDAVLAGRARVVASLPGGIGGADGRERVLEPGVPASDVRLTIDASLQLQLEKELYAAWVADRSVRVSALVLDPDDGQVLAWASVPGYDANAFTSVAAAAPDLFQDPLLSQVYEPGSVMKMFTAAAALDRRTVHLDTIVRDTAVLRIGPDTVRNADWRGKGRMRFRDAIAYSRNVATARTAMSLGRDLRRSSEALYATWRRFGLAEKTGIDLSNELAGIVADPARRPWQPIDLANRAFGQGVAVTPLQLGVAYAAMANGGLRVTPHVMAAVGDEPAEVRAPERVVDRRLAGELRELLEHVVSSVPWYAEGTLIPGYRVGGKTGTAQIWDPGRGKWTWNTFNFTFAGFVGAERPEAIVVTRIHNTQPKVRGQGELELGITSYELFRRIAVDAMAALDVAPLRGPRAQQALTAAAAEEAAEDRRAAQARRDRTRAREGPQG